MKKRIRKDKELAETKTEELFQKKEYFTKNNLHQTTVEYTRRLL